MAKFIIFLLIGAAGIVLGHYWAVRNKTKKVKGLIVKQREEKEENKLS